MVELENIWHIYSEEEFQREALKIFRFQAEACATYRQYLQMVGCQVAEVQHTSQIPFLPIELFKSCDIYSAEREPEMVFTSSSTSGKGESRHMMYDLKIYERAFSEAFHAFYGDPKGWSIYGLLPSYLEREGSSLIYMVDRLIAECGSGGFYLDDYERLLGDMNADPKPKILLGVSYALWDLAERHAPKFDNTVVMETGGMKGHRNEIPKSEFHKILCDAFGVKKIHSEYGMAELTSQGYSVGDNIFRTPAWMRVVVREVNDPISACADGELGGLNIIDLASRYSCSFIETQDLGRRYSDGSFTVEGRIQGSDIRGCNLLVQ